MMAVMEKIYNNFKDFLINRKWQIIDTGDKYDVLKPPVELGFSSSYKLYFYNRFDRQDFEKEMYKYLELICEIYRSDSDILNSILINDSEVLAIHLSVDKNTNKPRLPLFDNVIHSSMDLLYEVANFAVIQKPHYYDEKEEAERYLNLCSFIGNDRGSLITKIELPNEKEIQKGSLFQKSINGHTINQRLINTLSFLNEKVLTKDDFDDDFLRMNKSFINVNIAQKLKAFYDRVELVDTDFTVYHKKGENKTFARDLNSSKMHNLSMFTRTVKEKNHEILKEIVCGKIVELKSKDVESDSNSVLIEGILDDVKHRFRLNLDSIKYKAATGAHMKNLTVRFKGLLEKTKTLYKVTEIDEFEILVKN